VHLLTAADWQSRAVQHAERADGLTQPHRRRRSSGEAHPVEDFLYTYYPTSPSTLRRWHPGVGAALRPAAEGPAPHTAWRFYSADDDGSVALDVQAFLAARGETVAFVRRLLTATASRPAHLGCFGLHEWAMVYGERERRHPLPLRLGQAGTDAVVDAHQLGCTHFDAFRFFTPAARPLNRTPLTRASQVDTDQPGCLHAAMDCHKWSMKLGPAVPGELALDCFELARDVRLLDMQASPYDLSPLGLAPVPIETAEGKAEYVARQRAFAERSARLRTRLVDVCDTLLER
jgi:hypothetical protein